MKYPLEMHFSAFHIELVSDNRNSTILALAQIIYS